MFEQEKEDTILDASYEVGTRKGQVQKKKRKETEKAVPEFRRERATFQELWHLTAPVSPPARAGHGERSVSIWLTFHNQ